MTAANLTQWALKHGISAQALHELDGIFGLHTQDRVLAADNSEAHVQSLVRLEAKVKGCRLWRNNVGTLKDVQGRPVRYGLANDSKALNDKLKSGDLIGWRRVLIEPRHVGTIMAQFVSRECKAPNWKYSGDARETAQLNWVKLVLADGGDAAFCNNEGSL